MTVYTYVYAYVCVWVCARFLVNSLETEQESFRFMIPAAVLLHFTHTEINMAFHLDSVVDFC